MIAAQSIADDLKKLYGTFFSTEAHTPADILKDITSGCRWLTNQRDWSFTGKSTTFTTTVDNETQAIQEVSKIFSVVDSNGSPVMYYGEFSDYHSVPRDVENYVGIWGTTFIARTPGTYTVIYSAYPPAVTSLLDTIAFPDSVYNVLMPACAGFGFYSVKDETNAAIQLNLANELLPPVAVRKTDPTPNKPVRVGSGYSY